MDYTEVIIEIDATLKSKADKLFSSLGFILEEAINLFLKVVVEQRKLPFKTDDLNGKI